MGRKILAITQAFTLLEVLIVVLILGILATFSLPAIEGMLIRAKFTEMFATVPAIERAVELYYIENNCNPPYLNSRLQSGIDSFSQTLGIDIPGMSSPFVYLFLNDYDAGIEVNKRDTGQNICGKFLTGEDKGLWWVNCNDSWGRYLKIPTDKVQYIN